MSTVYLRDTQVLKPFDCSETAGISAHWERWLRAFELFATGKGVKNADQEKVLLLHTFGLDVQDIYFTLEEEGGSENYRKATATLNKYFKPQANVPNEREKARTCEFGDANAVEEQIRDQVINKCLSHELRRKLRQKGQPLTLQRLREIARAMEESEKQARSIEGGSDASNGVNSVDGKVDRKEDLSTRNVKCFCCGNVGHKASDHQYPARGKQCRKETGQDILRQYEKQQAKLWPRPRRWRNA